MNKRELRLAVRAKAAQLTDEYKARAGQLITARVRELEQFKKARAVFCYVSTESEPDTAELIRLVSGLGKTIALPKCGKKPYMKAVIIEDTGKLVRGVYGIMEPDSFEPEAELTADDVVIVPCVSADRRGGRLGHGAGYYDVFLENCPAYRLCLCFEEMIADAVPMDGHDAVMDCVVTESGVYYAAGKH